MAWTNTSDDRFRHLLRQNIGATVRLSQVFSLAPYPLSLFQTNCSLSTIQMKAVLFFRLLVALSVTILTVSSLFVLYFCYPWLLYLPTVPVFIKILYYITSTLQILTVANLLIGCEYRREQYEEYFQNVLFLIRATTSQRPDCQQTVWFRKTVKVLLVTYCAAIIVLPICFTSILLDIATLPYMLVHIVPFSVSALTLLQYYCVVMHLASIVRKLNDRLISNVDEGTASEGSKTIEKAIYMPPGHTYAIYPLKMEVTFQLIEEMRLLHVKVIEIASALSEHFSVVIILIVVATFASVNIELLELYQCIKEYKFPPLVITLKSFYAAIKFLFYVLIAYPNWLLQKENHRTLVLLYSIKRASCSDDANGAIEHYISQISNMQDIHQACGMVNLDMKLISNAVTAITSIMVVLIQFSDAGK